MKPALLSVTIDWHETNFYKLCILKDSKPNDFTHHAGNEFLVRPGEDMEECDQLIEELHERQLTYKPRSKHQARTFLNFWKKAQATLRMLYDDFLPMDYAESEFTHATALEKTV